MHRSKILFFSILYLEVDQLEFIFMIFLRFFMKLMHANKNLKFLEYFKKISLGNIDCK
jgi:hypothetical protein